MEGNGRGLNRGSSGTEDNLEKPQTGWPVCGQRYEAVTSQIQSRNDNTGQQNLTFFLAHEEKYLILIELLTLNSNV